MIFLLRALGWLCIGLSLVSLSPLVIGVIDVICWTLTGHTQIANWTPYNASIAVVLVVLACVLFVAGRWVLDL